MFKGYYSTFPEVAPVYQRDPELFRTRRMAKSIADGPIIRRAHHQDLMMLALSPMMKERSCIAKERVVQSIADHIEVGVSIKDFSDLFILKQIYDKADWGVIRGLKSHFVDRSPALDNQLLDFAISAPLKWKKDGNIVRTALKMVDKRMASLHDANTNLPAGICSPWRNILVNCKRIPRYTLDKLTPFFPALSNVRHHKSGQEVFKMHYSWHDMNALLVKSQLYRQILQESIAQLDQSMFDVKMIESLFTDETKSAAPSLFKLFEIVVTFGVFDKNWSPNGKRESILKKPSDAEINLCHDRL